MGPFHRVLGRHALRGFGVHVGDDVLGQDLGGLAVGQALEARRAAELAGGAERRHHGILAPHLVLLPLGRRSGAEAFLRHEPALVVRRRVDPAEQLLGRRLILRVAHQHVGLERMQRELAGRTARHRRVQDVGMHPRALLGLVVVRLAQRLDVDRGAVQGRADGAGQEGAVVAGVVPGDPGLVMGFLPERGHELDRLDRRLAVEHDLAAGVDLAAAERPQQRIDEGDAVAERVGQGLADRVALGLELLAGGAVLVPGLGELGHADLVEPRFAIGQERADDHPRQPQPAVLGVGLAHFVIAALLAADLLGEVAEVDDALGVEMRPVVERHDDVGPGGRLDRRRDARLDVVGVDGLEPDLGAERLLGLGHQGLAQQLVRCRDEIAPAQPVQLGPLGKGRGPPGRQDAGQTAGGGGRRTAGRERQEIASGHTPSHASHGVPPCRVVVGFLVRTRRAGAVHPAGPAMMRFCPRGTCPAAPVVSRPGC